MVAFDSLSSSTFLLKRSLKHFKYNFLFQTKENLSRKPSYTILRAVSFSTEALDKKFYGDDLDYVTIGAKLARQNYGLTREDLLKIPFNISKNFYDARESDQHPLKSYYITDLQRHAVKKQGSIEEVKKNANIILKQGYWQKVKIQDLCKLAKKHCLSYNYRANLLELRKPPDYILKNIATNSTLKKSKKEDKKTFINTKFKKILKFQERFKFFEKLRQGNINSTLKKQNSPKNLDYSVVYSLADIQKDLNHCFLDFGDQIVGVSIPKSNNIKNDVPVNFDTDKYKNKNNYLSEIFETSQINKIKNRFFELSTLMNLLNKALEGDNKELKHDYVYLRIKEQKFSLEPVSKMYGMSFSQNGHQQNSQHQYQHQFTPKRANQANYINYFDKNLEDEFSFQLQHRQQFKKSSNFFQRFRQRLVSQTLRPSLFDKNLQNDPAIRQVFVASCVNLIQFFIKFFTALLTGSASMFSESMHSLSDIQNQLFQLWGIHNSKKKADAKHPYGYGKERNFFGICQAMSVLFVGGGFSLYRAIQDAYSLFILNQPQQISHVWPAFFVVGCAFFLESFSMSVAFRQVRRQAKSEEMTFFEYIKWGSDPINVSIMIEDGCGMISSFILASALSSYYITNNPIYDIIGSLMIGGLLSSSGLLMLQKNRRALIGNSLPAKKISKICAMLQNDPVISADGVYDVKCTQLGINSVRFKAEIMFNAEAIARRRFLKLMKDRGVLPPYKRIMNLKTEKEIEDFQMREQSNQMLAFSHERQRIEKLIRNELGTYDIVHVDIETI